MSSSTIDFTIFHNIVDGKPRGGKDSYRGISSVTEEDLWDAPIAQKQDVEDAVISATKAFRSWSHLPYSERAELVKAWAAKLASLQAEFTDLSMTEGGKPVR